MVSLVQQISENGVWTNKFLNVLSMINTTALRSAIYKVRTEQEFQRNFVLFHYNSGFSNGTFVDECIPGLDNITIASYVHSRSFYECLIGSGVDGVKFRLWSRNTQKVQNTSERQLMLTIKQANKVKLPTPPKVVRQSMPEQKYDLGEGDDDDDYYDMPGLSDLGSINNDMQAKARQFD